MTGTEKKCSFIALIGSPNAGKSTLLNQLVGYKVSIVTPKVQTTRNIINGISIYKNSQLIFVDTPGIFSPAQNRKLESYIVENAWSSIKGVDKLALLIDASKGVCNNSKLIIEKLAKRKLRAVAIINKVDLVKKSSLLTLAAEINNYGIFDQIFMVSALSGEGVEDLKAYFADNAPSGPWMYPEDDITNIPRKIFAAEIVREKLFLALERELPYNLTAITESWEELSDGSAKVRQVIYTNKESHKKIIIGKGGAMLKKIGEAARLELEELLGQKIHLFLFVKLRENWIDKIESIENL